MAERVEELRPRLIPNLLRRPLPEGTTGLRNTAGGEYLEIEADEASVLDLMNGAHDLAEISRAYFERFGRFSIKRVLQLIINLADRGMLENQPDELKAMGVHIALEERGGGLVGRAMLWLSAIALSTPATTRMARTICSRWLLAPAIAVFAVVVSLFGLDLFLFGGRPGGGVLYNPFTVNGSYLAGLVGLALSLSLVLSVRQWLRGVFLSDMKCEILRGGVALFFGIPYIWVDTRDVFMAGRRGRLMLAFVGLFSFVAAGLLSLVLALAVGSEAAGAFFSQAALVAVLALFVDACPFLGGDMDGIIQGMVPDVDWRRHTQSYLYKRLILRVFSFGDHFAGERVFIAIGLYGLLWIYFALKIIAGFAARYTGIVWGDFQSQAGIERAAAGVLAALFLVLAVLTVSAFVLAVARVLLSLVFKPSQALLGGRPRVLSATAIKGDDALARELRGVHIFAALDDDALRTLAHDVVLETHSAGSRIIRQGDAGDRFYSIRRGEAEVLFEDQTGLEQRVAVLRAGDGFGEIALIKNTARTASVRALGEVEVFAISRQTFDEFVKRSGIGGERITDVLRISQFLKGVPFFADLSGDQLVRLATRLRRQPIAPGQDIIREGDKGDLFYVVRGGKVRVHAADVGGGERELAVLGGGEYFGEIALLHNVPRTATVTAVEDGEVLALGKEEFFDVINSNFLLSMNLERTAWRRLEITNAT